MKTKSQTRQNRQIVALSLLAIGVSGTTTATAQTGSVMEEVVVTATKREESLRDVPMSVSVLGSDTIEAKGITQFRGIADAVPGLTYSEASSNLNPTFQMRGISVGQNTEGLQKAVAIYLDEMPMQDGKSTVNMDFGLFDTARVEVLKGPQGTLFGAGTLAGASELFRISQIPVG